MHPKPSVSEPREIIRPKKKPDRFRNKLVEKTPSSTSIVQKVSGTRHNLETIEEVSKSGASPERDDPAAVSEVIVRKQVVRKDSATNGSHPGNDHSAVGTVTRSSESINDSAVSFVKSEGEPSNRESTVQQRTSADNASEPTSNNSQLDMQNKGLTSLSSINSTSSRTDSSPNQPIHVEESSPNIQLKSFSRANNGDNGENGDNGDETTLDYARVTSLSDIKLREAKHRRLGNDMTADQENDFEAGESPNYKRDRSRFNIDDVRKKDEGIDEQNKLINAIISQKNSEMVEENKRTKDIMNSVRSNMRNNIQSKRDVYQPKYQVSTNKFLNEANSPRRDVKLSSVNMNMFGDIDEVQRQRTVNIMQVKKLSQKQKKPKRRKKALPPLERGAPIAKELEFHLPKL